MNPAAHARLYQPLVSRIMVLSNLGLCFEDSISIKTLRIVVADRGVGGTVARSRGSFFTNRRSGGVVRRRRDRYPGHQTLHVATGF